MDKELVSIVIPVYNVEKYLEECILSVINQDYENIEIILIDDESTDNSLNICEKYSNENPKVKCFSQKNQGVSVARNLGIEKANGKWICFVDGDDYLESNYVSQLVDIIDEDKYDYVVTPPIMEYFDTSKKGIIFEEDKIFDVTNKDILELNIICRQYDANAKNDIGAGAPWGKLYNRNFLVKNDLKFKVGLKRMQDVLFNLHVANVSSKVFYKNVYGYHYRINDSSVCLKYNKNIFNIFEEVLEEFKKFICENNKSDKYYQALYQKSILMYIEGMRISALHINNKESFSNKLKFMKDIYNKEIFEEAFKKISLKGIDIKIKVFVVIGRLKLVSMLYFMIKIFMKTKKKNQD